MPATQNANRAYSAAHFVLELDGNNSVGVIRSVDGGGVKSEIMTYQMGDNHDLWRQISKPKYEDLKIEFGMSMSKEFYNWIKAFFDGEVVRKNGAVVAGDFHYKERARREFQEAIISEISFPKLDGGDKNPCYMTASLAPETLRFAKGTMRDLETTIGKMNQKLWTSANFELRLDGFEAACKRITKVDGFTIKQQVHDYHAGNQRDPLRVPGLLEFPNITFYVPEADAQAFIDHFNEFGIGGKVQKPARHTGGIVCRDHAANDLCTVSLKGVDIASVVPEKSDSTSEEIKQVKVELAIESMAFDYNDSAIG
ncbi:phage tail protein [Haliangium sp.]|uniref:phage tail protein n=1 Tax=Haliangium sp. TaxID=2663208 RepID=UPI003D098E35